jgi:hypothetical protein
MTIKGRTFGRNFWRQAVERAVKTAGQAGLLAVGADATNVLSGVVNRPAILLGAIGSGFVLSILTSLATAPVGQPDDPSAVAKTTP